jgi:hypothetical protein
MTLRLSSIRNCTSSTKPIFVLNVASRDRSLIQRISVLSMDAMICLRVFNDCPAEICSGNGSILCRVFSERLDTQFGESGHGAIPD